MTNNEIAYWALQETKRSNIARETENYRHNTVVEHETGRHNNQEELVAFQNYYESARHNKASEANQRYASQLSYNATITAANISASAHRYAAQLSAQAQRYSADTAAAASRYNARTSALQSARNTAANNKANLQKAQYEAQSRSNVAKIQGGFSSAQTAATNQTNLEIANKRNTTSYATSSVSSLAGLFAAGIGAAAKVATLF